MTSANDINIISNNNNKFSYKIVWRMVIILSLFHLGAIYGFYLLITSAKILTILYTCYLHFLVGFGITGGSHRLWSHRSYKGRFPYRVMLMILNTMALQDSIWIWSRDHRLHHKYSETNADPHNAKRGFFFSHIGWLMVRKHPDVKEKGKGIDMSDLDADPVVVFQKKYYTYLVLFFAFLLPTAIPVYLWNESWKNSFFISSILNWVYNLNVTGLVNSAAHLYGDKPYDKEINPSENWFVNLATSGEGYHNYHHTFPWDYKTGELPVFPYNLTTKNINLFAKIGWAYDFKNAPSDVIEQRIRKTGDGNHNLFKKE